METGLTQRLASLLVLVSMLVWIASPLSAAAIKVEPAPAPQAPEPLFSIVAPEKDCSVTAGEPLSIMVVTNLENLLSVSIMCDDRGVALLDKAPYSASLVTDSLLAGQHVVRAIAYLRNGDKISAIPVPITVIAKPEVKPLFLIDPELATPIRPAVEPVVLKDGTPVMLKTLKEMTSGDIPVGSTVEYVVMRDVVGPGNKVLINRGSRAYGKVIQSRKRGMLGKSGKLEFTVENVAAVDGTNVPLRGSEKSTGRNNAGAVVATVLLLSIFCLFINGRDVTIPPGTEIAAYIDQDITINAISAKLADDSSLSQGETVNIAFPNGSQVRQGSALFISVLPQPADKAYGMRVVLAGTEIANRNGDFSPLTVSTDKLPVGTNALRVEVTFRSGLVVRQSAEVTILPR